MRRIALSILVMLVVALWAAAPSGARTRRAAPAKCPPASSHVLLADGQAAVYTVHASKVEMLEGQRVHEAVIQTRGCADGRKGSHEIWQELAVEPTEVHEGISNLTLSGAVVAYEQSYYGGSRYSTGEETPEEWHVIVRNLQTGRILHKAPTGAKEKDHPKFIGDGPTTAIVVKADGAVAWILDTVQSENRYQVHALDKTGERTLAVGSNIDPNSLALAGSTLYWTQNGKSESASLN
jgi:hypothetical protein